MRRARGDVPGCVCVHNFSTFVFLALVLLFTLFVR